jgi:hypothetical protein
LCHIIDGAPLALSNLRHGTSMLFHGFELIDTTLGEG